MSVWARSEIDKFIANHFKLLGWGSPIQDQAGEKVLGLGSGRGTLAKGFLGGRRSG